MTTESKALVLSIDEDGNTQLSVGGLIIGLHDEIRVEVSGNLKPRIKIVFASTSGLPKNNTKVKILELLHRYREVLEKHPCVEIFDTVETLPYMEAVRPNPDDPDPSDPKTSPG